MSREDQKRRIVEAAAGLIHAKGFHHTGIQEILDAARIPRGSFYFYFKNKQDLGIHVINYFGRELQSMVRRHLHEPGPSALAGLRGLFLALAEIFEESGFCRGCPIGNLAQELSDEDDAFREALLEVIDGLKSEIEGQLERAKDLGEISASTSVVETADFIVNAWQGAVLRMKVTKTAEPIKLFDRMIFEGLLGSAQKPGLK
jgi:TetR/AcrR family transcriptional repressor of nem operon